ncbi:response regulator [Streptomyces lunaelactis]|uniref:response regulator n=1 Tax=Streptomyces lunaelactis TaxID=1535768 RepID=UPI0020C826F4|nr:response regulator [Streptomyces lunaelactis]
MKILVVDDREDNLFAIESLLRPVGRPVVRAHSGDEALKTVLRGGIAVIILDVVMPRMDGLEVLAYLKRLDHTRNLPVVLMTGLGRDDDLAARAYDLGVSDFLVKPVDPWVVRTKVRALADLYIENQSLREQLHALTERRTGTGTSTAHHPDLVEARVPRRPGGSTDHARSVRGAD